MKRSALRFFTIAVLLRTALASMPVLADDLLGQASAEAASAVSGTAQHEKPARELLRGVADWLSTELGLSSSTPPHVEFVAPERLSRLRGLMSDDQGDGRDVVALYDDEARIIYLPRGWRALSVIRASGTPARAL